MLDNIIISALKYFGVCYDLGKFIPIKFIVIPFVIITLGFIFNFILAWSDRKNVFNYL